MAHGGSTAPRAESSTAAEAGVDAGEFRRALARFGSGVTVITVRTAAGRDHGMTASAFTSLSLSPPLVLVAVKKGNRMHAHLEAAPGFAVNVLSEHQDDLSTRFAGGIVGADGGWKPWPEERDKFVDLPLERGPSSGAALLDGTLASLDCSRHALFDGGDHTVFVGRVHGARFAPPGVPLRPLLYFAGAYRALLRDPVEEGQIGLRVPDWFD